MVCKRQMKVKSGKCRSTIKQRPTRKERKTPAAEYKKVCLRSGGDWKGGECIGGHCEVCGNGFTKLDFAHWGKHRQMGGTNNPEVHSDENIKRVCRACHDKHDGHGTLPRQKPVDNTPEIFHRAGRPWPKPQSKK